MKLTDLGKRDLWDVFLDSAHREAEPNQGQIGHSRMMVKQIDEANRRIHFVCSTSSVDRYGEVVEPTAFEGSLAAFMLNPIFQAGHVYAGPAGEPATIGSWVKLWTTDTTLEGIAEFDDEDPLAQRYWNLYRKRHRRAVSVGFIAVGWEMRDIEVDGVSQRVRVFTEVELLEISAVAVPACRQALARAAGMFTAEEGDEAIELDGDRLDQAVERAVERSLSKHLDTGLEGRLCALVLEVAQAMHGSVGPGVKYLGDFNARATPENEPGRGDESQQHAELCDAVRDALGGDAAPGSSEDDRSEQDGS